MDTLTPRGGWAVFPGDPDYPGRLSHLADPPSPLYVRGDMGALARPCVTIVGSRRSTEYGRRVARALASSAVQAGWTVLSGMALGIDGAAHRGALAGGGPTLAVLGSGPDVPAPRSHTRLMDEILAGGAVMSEYPPGTGARPHHFPRRNRILAALAHRVVIVEAALRSGALITANEALELGREVWVVPGSIFSPGSPGTHRLLEEGATPVTSLEAWQASLLDEGAAPAVPGSPGRVVGTNPESGEPGDVQLPLGLAGEGLASRIWDLLDGEPLSLDQMMGRLGVEPGQVISALSRLELGGWVERSDGEGYRRSAA